MRRSLRRIGLAAGLALTCLAGCKTAEHTYPNDPLLLSQKPLERPAEAARPAVVVNREPEIPPLPEDALVAQPPPALPPSEEAAPFGSRKPRSRAELDREDLHRLAAAEAAPGE